MLPSSALHLQSMNKQKRSDMQTQLIYYITLQQSFMQRKAISTYTPLYGRCAMLCASEFNSRPQAGGQHLINLLHYRAPCGNIALAGLHHNLLTHPDGGLPEGDVGEGCSHGASSYFHLQLHAAPKALFPDTEVALLQGRPTFLQGTACTSE